MDTQDKINLLRKQLSDLESLQKSCNHNFGEPYQSFNEEKEFIYEMKFQGVDAYHDIVGSKTKQVPVWKRKCSLCGIVQTTTKTEPVVQSHRPIF